MSTNFDTAFQEATKDSGQFNHAAHVRVAWTLLEHLPVLEALAHFCSGLQALTRSHGQPEKYHETITVAFVFLILERRAQQGASSWEAFAALHHDLLVSGRQGDLLQTIYPAELLTTPEARAHFVVPPIRP